jgi:hypothetical protein
MAHIYMFFQCSCTISFVIWLIHFLFEFLDLLDYCNKKYNAWLDIANVKKIAPTWKQHQCEKKISTMREEQQHHMRRTLTPMWEEEQ